MRPLRTLLQLLLSVLLVLQAAQARIPYAYVANNSANTVMVINTSSGTVVKTIAVGSFPYGVAVQGTHEGCLVFLARTFHAGVGGNFGQIRYGAK